MDHTHTSGSRDKQHVISMRRSSAGIHWRVIQRESMTRVPATFRPGGQPGRGSSRRRLNRQASSCSVPLTCKRPTARHPAGTQASISDRKPISGKASASRKPGPASIRSSHGDPVLTALARAASRTVEFSIGSLTSTWPVSGRRPRTDRPAPRTANDACDRPGSTRQLPETSRGCPSGRSGMPGIVVTGSPSPAGQATRCVWPYVPRPRRQVARGGHAATAWWRARHTASASPIGVAAGPWTKGQISSEMARQSAVADSSPSTANRPRLMRWRIT